MGIDPHKKTHTAVAAAETRRALEDLAVPARRATSGSSNGREVSTSIVSSRSRTVVTSPVRWSASSSSVARRSCGCRRR